MATFITNIKFSQQGIKDKIVAKVDGWLPRQHAPVIRRLAAEIDESLAGFIRGS